MTKPKAKDIEPSPVLQIGIAAGIAGVVVAGCGAAVGIFEPGSNRYRWKLGF